MAESREAQLHRSAGGGDEGRPLVLMALSTDRAQSSQWVRPLEGRAVVTVHPEAAAGVPDSTPPGDNVSPDGKEPTTTDHDVYGSLPPLAVRDWLYGCPCVAGGSGFSFKNLFTTSPA